MIYILIPNEIDSFFEIRVFSSYSSVEQAAKDEGRERRSKGFDPDWCRIFAYAIGVDEYIPTWLFTLTPLLDMKRVPISSP